MDLKERLNKIQERNSKVRHKTGRVWPMEKKVETVTQFLVLGNLRLVAAAVGVGYDLVRQWKTQSWWIELEKEIRASQNIEMDTRLSKIVEKSLDATLDRVENGDFIYDQKSGEIRRKPVALRDVHRVAVDLLSKQEVLRKGANDRNEGTQVSVQEHLKMLAAEMAKMGFTAPKKHVVIDLIEEDVEDAIPKEREEGLQTGTGVGTLEETESSPRESGAEQGSLDAGEEG